MIVSAWKGATYGIRVGLPNAQKYFNRQWDTIEVEIDDKSYIFNLSPTFWTTCPEFRGQPIKKWLNKQGLIPWPNGKPPKIELVPIKYNKFRLNHFEVK